MEYKGLTRKPLWWQWSVSHKKKIKGSKCEIQEGPDPLGPSAHSKKFGINFSFSVVQTTVLTLDATCCFDSHKFLSVNKQRVERPAGTVQNMEIHEFVCNPWAETILIFSVSF